MWWNLSDVTEMALKYLVHFTASIYGAFFNFFLFGNDWLEWQDDDTFFQYNFQLLWLYAVLV